MHTDLQILRIEQERHRGSHSLRDERKLVKLRHSLAKCLTFKFRYMELTWSITILLKPINFDKHKHN